MFYLRNQEIYLVIISNPTWDYHIDEKNGNLTKTTSRIYTLSLLENDHDVSAYSRGRCLLSHANMVVFSHIHKRIPELKHNNGYILQRISFGALSNVTVVLQMRQSIRDNTVLFCFYFWRFREEESNQIENWKWYPWWNPINLVLPDKMRIVWDKMDGLFYSLFAFIWVHLFEFPVWINTQQKYYYSLCKVAL